MAVTQAYSQSALSVSTTELSITGGTSTIQTRSTPGVYQLYVSTSNLAKGDEFRIRIYEQTISGGSQRVVGAWTLLGVQGENFVTPPLMLMHGWDFTIVRLAGADRTFNCSVRMG